MAACAPLIRVCGGSDAGGLIAMHRASHLASCRCIPQAITRATYRNRQFCTLVRLAVRWHSPRTCHCPRVLAIFTLYLTLSQQALLSTQHTICRP